MNVVQGDRSASVHAPKVEASPKRLARIAGVAVWLIARGFNPRAAKKEVQDVR